MKKRTKIIVVIILILTSFIFYRMYQQGKTRMQWRTYKANTSSITESITATGTINPVVKVNIGTEVSGKIERIYKDFNDYVKRGELLAKIDTQTLEMNLEEARIDLRKTQLNAHENLIDLNSAKELHKKNMIPLYDLQRAQYNYDISLENIKRAEFSVQRAETNLNNAYIRSPIDGVIISRAVDEGQTVAASLNAPTLFIIANNLDEMQIEAQVDEADIGKLRNNLRVRFTVDAFPELNFNGRVSQIRLNPITEQNVVTYKVIISINNPDKILMPGMTANVEIIINQKNNILVIQERALQFRPTKEIWDEFGLKWDDSLVTPRTRGRSQQRPGTETTTTVRDTLRSNNQGTPGEGRGRRNQLTTQSIPAQTVQTANVWILENNGPKQIQIQTGISNGTFIEIISGLEEGQEVITGVNYTTGTQTTSSAFSQQPQRRF